MEQRTALSHSEWLIMQEIWRRGTASFREICDGVAEQHWSGPAVAAFLKRMEAKGAIACTAARPVKLYAPLIQREAAVEEETRDLLRRVYGGDVALLAQSLVASRALDEEELAELIALLRKGREGS